MWRSFATMIDIGSKSPTYRVAVASGRIKFLPDVYQQVITKGSIKGDLYTVSKVAGIQAAKKTSELLPLCHNLPLEKVEVEVSPDADTCSIIVRAEVRTSSKTGVEMEALTAVSAACLTLYDMTKVYSHQLEITDIKLVSKTGGKSDLSAKTKLD